MTALTDQVPVDKITARGRQARPGRVLLSLVLGFFYVLGLIPGRLWLGAVDCAVAVRLGYRRGRGLPPLAPPGPPA